jgi:hypothetical protein
MAANGDLVSFKNFPVQEAMLELWVFKKRSTEQGALYTARWVATDPDLQTALKNVVTGYQAKYAEVEAYTLLAQPTENGFLHVEAIDTNFQSLKDLVDRPSAEHRARAIKDLNNAAGYVVRLSFENSILYGIRRTTPGWKSKRARGQLYSVFRDETLAMEPSPTFALDATYDFFAIGSGLLVPNKLSFESLLSYKRTYQHALAELSATPAFSNVFTSLDTITAYVGTNTTHLRRMATILDKALYNRPDYMGRLREVSNAQGWPIQFNEDGKIIPTVETMKDIMQVLLDHRLFSQLSLSTYDVPSATQV